MSRDIEKEIKEHWFKDHVATLTKHGDLEVLDWSTPGTSFYMIRYVFDGAKMYISGDLGEAVFWLTWKSGVHNFNDINLHYFDEKLRAFSDEKRDYNGETAAKRLKEKRRDLIEDRTKYDRTKMKEIIEIARGCSSTRDWVEVVNGYEYGDFIRELDNDYWEWIYEIGDEIPKREQSYLIGLKMASEQLKAKE